MLTVLQGLQTLSLLPSWDWDGYSQWSSEKACQTAFEHFGRFMRLEKLVLGGPISRNACSFEEEHPGIRVSLRISPLNFIYF